MKKVVLKDIAQHVGVSTALVSYVLNGLAEEKQVGKEVAEKIRQAALELNYRPNQIAKSLKIRKTHTIGLVVADINYRFSYGITRAIEEEAKRRKYTVIFGSSNEDHEKFSEIVNVLVNRQVDGLILVPVENSENQIKSLQKSEVPFVLVDRNFPGIPTNFIAIDNHKASHKSTVHLIDTGHKRIGFINYKTSLFHLHERNNGYLTALKDHGIVFDPSWIQEVRDTHLQEDMEVAIDRLISLPEPCDAVFFATDVLAMKGLKYINQLKLNVPNTISVLSFDESEAFELFYCPITHARQPLEEMGKLAVDILVDLINHNKVLKQIYLESDFVVGQSCKER
jgi:LacI family transcriptional regulator